MSWKPAGRSTAVTAGKKIILYTHSAVHEDFLPLGSQSMHLRTSLFHVDDHLENKVEDS